MHIRIDGVDIYRKFVFTAGLSIDILLLSNTNLILQINKAELFMVTCAAQQYIYYEKNPDLFDGGFVPQHVGTSTNHSIA
jgi:hypothetical protein